MLLIPKIITKKRYSHKINFEGSTKGNKEITWGQFGLKALTGCWMTNKQIESARRVLSRFVKNFGKIKINIFPHLGKVKKPAEVRMGAGKGSIESYVAVVRKGTVMFEIRLNELKYKEFAYKGLKESAYKLPIKCKIIDNIN